MINFSGEVLAATCVINGGNNDLAVSLHPVNASALSRAGQVAGNRPFQLRLSDCAPGISRVSTYFEPGPTISPEGRLITDAGGADNVQLQLLNNARVPINLAGANGSQNSQIVPIASGGAILQYSVNYYATGAATPGPVSSRVQYSLNYL
ncbi:fimbrial protein [Pseudomonas shirazensis]|uniref:fimbrial protein n=1 Tax=Pseudomonas shirazensis TaxID=2745494 RepID=UPI003D28F5C4